MTHGVAEGEMVGIPGAEIKEEVEMLILQWRGGEIVRNWSMFRDRESNVTSVGVEGEKIAQSQCFHLGKR